MPSRRTLLKPESLNVTAYVPGRRSTMRYTPLLSVTAVRTFSMRSGLEASTVTPGRTAPDGSRTTPVRATWAKLRDGTKRHRAAMVHAALSLPMGGSFERVTTGFVKWADCRSGWRVTALKNPSNLALDRPSLCRV
jgi:hypothetical protein